MENAKLIQAYFVSAWYVRHQTPQILVLLYIGRIRCKSKEL